MIKSVPALLLVSAVVACSPEKAMQAATEGPAATAAPTAAASASAAAAPPPPPVAKTDLTENDFVESDRNRDPFRSYASVIAPQRATVTRDDRLVVLPQFSLDELKLVAIVTGGDNRAMLIDPGGKGWVIKRGDWVGRPEIVHVGGANGADYQINWRVEKVREGDIVFTREDPAQPGIPPASRVIALRPDGEADNQPKL